VKKPFVIWLLLLVLTYGGLGAATHIYFSLNPQRLFVGLDASFGMRAKWPEVITVMSSIEKNYRYAEFALATGKNRVHGWQPNLRLGTTLTYGPRDFSKFANDDYSELQDADRTLLITNAPNLAENLSSRGWSILQP